MEVTIVYYKDYKDWTPVFSPLSFTFGSGRLPAPAASGLLP